MRTLGIARHTAALVDAHVNPKRIERIAMSVRLDHKESVEQLRRAVFDPKYNLALDRRSLIRMKDSSRRRIVLRRMEDVPTPHSSRKM